MNRTKKNPWRSQRATLAAALSALVAVALSAAGSPAEATVLEDLDLSDLVARSSAVVVGRVEASGSHFTKGGHQIVTDIEVSVSERVVGQAPQTLVVRQQGGQVGQVGMRVSGNARFAVGEEVVLFLIEQGGLYYTVGMELGKYSVRRDPETGARRVYRPTTVPVAQVKASVRKGGMLLKSADATYEGALLSTLLTDVVQLAAGGADVPSLSAPKSPAGGER